MLADGPELPHNVAAGESVPCCQSDLASEKPTVECATLAPRVICVRFDAQLGYQHEPTREAPDPPVGRARACLPSLAGKFPEPRMQLSVAVRRVGRVGLRT
jgi:hypothetical protein